MPDEIQRLIMQVQNEQEIQKLTGALKSQQEAWQSLIKHKESFEAGHFDEMQRIYAARIVETTGKIRELEGAERALTARPGGMQNKLAITYMLDDFLNTSGGVEAKIRSISNNIPQLLMGVFGAGAPWLGGVAIAGTALVGLLGHWTDLMQAFKSGDTAQAEAALKRLQAQAKATSEEFKKLVESAGTPAGKKEAGKFKGAFENLRPQDVEQAASEIAGNLMDGIGMTDAEKATLASHDAALAAADQLKAIDPKVAAQRREEAQARKDEATWQIKRRRDEEAMNQARRMITDAGKQGGEGAAARERLKNHVLWAPDRFPPELVASMRKMVAQDNMQGPPIEAMAPGAVAEMEAQRAAANAVGPPGSLKLPANVINEQERAWKTRFDVPAGLALTGPQREAADKKEAAEKSREMAEAGKEAGRDWQRTETEKARRAKEAEAQQKFEAAHPEIEFNRLQQEAARLEARPMGSRAAERYQEIQDRMQQLHDTMNGLDAMPSSANLLQGVSQIQARMQAMANRQAWLMGPGVPQGLPDFFGQQ